MHEPTERPLRQLLHAVSRDETHDDVQTVESNTGNVPPLGQQAADAVRKSTEISAADLERAAHAMRYAGNRIAGEIEMFTSLALLVSTKTRAVTER
jgi:hypothetical protein